MGSAEIEQDFSLSLIWPSCHPLKVVCSFLHCNEAINLFFKGFLFLSPPLPPPHCLLPPQIQAKCNCQEWIFWFPAFLERALLLLPCPNVCNQPFPVLLSFLSPLNLTPNPHLSYLCFPTAFSSPPSLTLKLLWKTGFPGLSDCSPLLSNSSALGTCNRGRRSSWSKKGSPGCAKLQRAWSWHWNLAEGELLYSPEKERAAHSPTPHHKGEP